MVIKYSEERKKSARKTSEKWLNCVLTVRDDEQEVFDVVGNDDDATGMADLGAVDADITLSTFIYTYLHLSSYLIGT